MLNKSWFLPCSVSQDPTLDGKADARERRRQWLLGFLLVRQETQLAILETARKAIYIVHTGVFVSGFISISQLP